MAGEGGSGLYDRMGRRKYLSLEEGARFVRVAPSLEPSAFALCIVLYWTGCRISEALELTPERIDRDGGRLVFRTLKRFHRRAGDERTRREVYRAVPVPIDVIAILDALERQRDERFLPWGRQAAWRRVKLAMRCAAIDGSAASPKGLRHHFGLMAATARVPPSLIQRWMGHAKLETTMIYLDAVGGEERGFAERMWKGSSE